jgi:uncharacterized membrane protein (DUF373 family)
MMNRKEKEEWRNWWHFLSRRVREAVFLAAWVLMTWFLDKYIVHPFPISGPPRYMLKTFEGIFDVVTLLELIQLLWPYKTPKLRWWKKK